MRSINALNLPMIEVLHRTLAEWTDDPGVAAVIIDGAGERGLCAGGDIKGMYESARGDHTYARDLWQTPGFGDTIDFVQTKQHYYLVHKNLNPSGIVPDGPDPSGWLTPHHREELGGRPFGDGTPPGPVREAERVPASHTAH